MAHYQFNNNSYGGSSNGAHFNQYLPNPTNHPEWGPEADDRTKKPKTVRDKDLRIDIWSGQFASYFPCMANRHILIPLIQTFHAHQLISAPKNGHAHIAIIKHSVGLDVPPEKQDDSLVLDNFPLHRSVANLIAAYNRANARPERFTGEPMPTYSTSLEPQTGPWLNHGPVALEFYDPSGHAFLSTCAMPVEAALQAAVNAANTPEGRGLIVLKAVPISACIPQWMLCKVPRVANEWHRLPASIKAGLVAAQADLASVRGDGAGLGEHML